MFERIVRRTVYRSLLWLGALATYLMLGGAPLHTTITTSGPTWLP
jgi:hypothetical protein